ncbi:autophagy protein 13 [Dispira simplex]|nr:autophagy protein 13 [Dispira simplex]
MQRPPSTASQCSDFTLSVSNISSSPSHSVPSRDSRGDQIVQNIFSKFAQVVGQTRSSAAHLTTGSSSSAPKVNKWFNLELTDHEPIKAEVKFWRAAVLLSTPPPPLFLEVYLDVRRLRSEQTLVVTDDRLRRWTVDLTPLSESRRHGSVSRCSRDSQRVTSVLLERWYLQLHHPPPYPPPDLPGVYKKTIVFFRALYSLVRLLPCYTLSQRLQGAKAELLQVSYRLTSTPTPSVPQELGFDTSLTGAVPGVTLYEFDPIVTHLGTFTAGVTYRTDCQFHIEEPGEPTSHDGVDDHYFSPNLGPTSPPTLPYRIPGVSATTASPFFAHPLPPVHRRAMSTATAPASLPVLGRPSVSVGGRRSTATVSSGSRSQSTSATRHSAWDSQGYGLPLHTTSAGEARPVGSLPSHRYGHSPTPTTTTAILRRPSLTLVTPFKSPSLSSSPISPHYFVQPSSSNDTDSSSLSRRPLSLTFSSSHPRHPWVPGSFTVPHSLGDYPHLPTPLPIPSGEYAVPRRNQIAVSLTSSTSPPRLSSSFAHRYAASSGDDHGPRAPLLLQSGKSTHPCPSDSSSLPADVVELEKMLDSQTPLRLTQPPDEPSPLSFHSRVPQESSKHQYPTLSKDLRRFRKLKSSYNHMADSIALNTTHDIDRPFQESKFDWDQLTEQFSRHHLSYPAREGGAQSVLIDSSPPYPLTTTLGTDHRHFDKNRIIPNQGASQESSPSTHLSYRPVKELPISGTLTTPDLDDNDSLLFAMSESSLNDSSAL